MRAARRGWSELAALISGSTLDACVLFLGWPSLFGDLAERLHQHGMADEHCRIVVEKPFGRDLETAAALNATLAEHFDESQIYRIDHYLGKETVQNLMAVRFGNMLFEPLWNSQYVDHIQITVAETVGVGGRGEYYDKSGAMRDMVQNHLMQLLCLIAMEPPSKFDPDAVRDEKLKVIRALDPVDPHHIVRGQYQAPATRARLPRRGWRPAIDHRKLCRDEGRISAIGGGRARRFICARASGWWTAVVEITVVFKERRISIFGEVQGSTAMCCRSACNPTRASRWA